MQYIARLPRAVLVLVVLLDSLPNWTLGKLLLSSPFLDLLSSATMVQSTADTTAVRESVTSYSAVIVTQGRASQWPQALRLLSDWEAMRGEKDVVIYSAVT